MFPFEKKLMKKTFSSCDIFDALPLKMIDDVKEVNDRRAMTKLVAKFIEKVKFKTAKSKP